MPDASVPGIRDSWTGADTAQSSWVRSANRDNAYNPFIVNADGNVNNNNAYNGNRAAPDCNGHGGMERRRIAPSAADPGARSPGPVPERAEHRGGDGPTSDGCAGPASAVDPMSFECLWEAMERCRRGVMWKGSVASFVLNAPTEVARLADELADGTYVQRPVRRFPIYYPKQRDIVAIPFRDRVFQRSLNDFVLYPAMSRDWIYDNASCQTGKGTDFARNRLKRFMREHYAKHGEDGWVLTLDVAGYYPNMPHATALAPFERHLDARYVDIVASILENQYTGDVGVNPGSQLVQIAGVSVLSPIDHMVKERLRVRHYIRYMDDSILISDSREELERALDVLTDEYAKLGFALNRKKTHIRPLSRGIDFLGFHFKLSPTGRVFMNVLSAKVKQERRHLKGVVRLAKRGVISKEDADASFEGWVAHVKKGDSFKLIRRMRRYYRDLWKGDTDGRNQANQWRHRG